jgi:O-antigen ligase
MKWFEWPILIYFAIHFFPPAPPALASLCLILGTFGILWEKRRQDYFGMAVLNIPIVWVWCLLTGLMIASLLQVPPDLQRESWNQLQSTFLKGSLFGLALATYLDSAQRVRRLLWAGMYAGIYMLLHCAFDTLWGIYTIGNLPFQRDYLFWLVFFFPFALSTFALKQGIERILAIFSAAGIFALAILTGFRGATLALLSMLLMYSVFIRLWSVLLGGLGLAGIGIGTLAIWSPTQTDYLFAKFRQLDDSERFSGHWLPAWDMAMLNPWTGKGFGHDVFAYQFARNQPDHPLWTWHTGVLPRGQHSIFLETLFSAGWPGLLSFLMLSGLLVGSLGRILWQERHLLRQSPWLLLSLAILTSYIGNFLIFYQFETPAWRTLPITVAIAAAIISARRTPAWKIS